ncbi:hypothetical protein HYQ46_010862 [Verticillium longisporum]|nr:hypothetical protein HYQ46_010862 [Verticillium longisporum]
MGFQGNLSVRLENVDGLGSTLLDILDKLLDWLLQNLSFQYRKGSVVGRQGTNPVGPLSLLRLTVRVEESRWEVTSGSQC